MNYYLGIDIGGTKIAGALITPAGRIVDAVKIPTPKKVKAKTIYQCITDTIDRLINTEGFKRGRLKGIGVGVPGIVDTRNNRILAAPNIDLTGFPLASRLRQRLRVPIAMGNDVNLGLLGEAWLGAARGLRDVVGIFPGTGVGGAALIGGHLVLGTQGAATELGHMIMDVNGPVCHCGNYGCLEALTSRWAIERDIRALVKAGRKSRVMAMTGGDLSMIKSRILKEALAQNDAVVKTVLTNAAGHLGKAAVSLNHIFNPQAIVFGGGVIKACGQFMLPIIGKTLAADPFFKKFNACRILPSQLGDDAVPLGAVRLVVHAGP